MGTFCFLDNMLRTTVHEQWIQWREQQTVDEKVLIFQNTGIPLNSTDSCCDWKHQLMLRG